ncbi:MAG TPA: EAL domain-containing protein [Sphingomonas sp.]|jgi:EAL domain-containing protein (putative c-di-GMP-specific phosphodiesterase class I)/GGDEF domain-containing protein
MSLRAVLSLLNRFRSAPVPEVVRSASARDEAHLRPDHNTHVAIFKVRDFEALRSELGFAASGEIMNELADRLRDVFTGCDVGRVGRTTLEIAFVESGSDPRPQLLRARAHLQRPVQVDGLELAFAIACGAARLDPARPVSESLDRAGGALVDAQASQSFVAVSSDDRRRADTIGDLELARALKAALDANTLQLFYQPKLHCRDDTVRSVEALLRWTHRELGAMPIERVICAAERTGVIRSLTDWVIKRASLDAATLADAGHDLTVYVNLSGRLLADQDYVETLIEQVSSTGGRIGFEITETAVIDDPADAIANVTAMSQAGIAIAIDDYGSGLSSLAYLKQLPARELKIDRMFIKDLIESHRDPLLVRSSIDLAHALEMEVTAEGVDDPMTLSLLRIMGCDIVQGYLIARALPLPELKAFLDDADQLQGMGRAPHALPDWSSPEAQAKQA